MDALPFLSSTKTKIGPLYIVHGDEAFLKRLVIRSLRKRAIGADADDQAVSAHPGDKASFAEVFDELDTVPFFFPRRIVIVENADPFVTKYRKDLEKKFTLLPATGLLILDVKSWPATTKLAKMIDSSATIVCKAPVTYRIGEWCTTWCAEQYQKQLPAAAANLLVDLVGADMGLLDQELLKLATYVGTKTQIELTDVDRLVGNNRAENTWKIFDAIATGNLKEGMAILHRLFEQGEEPLRILGAFSMQLRRLAQAARLTSHGVGVSSALGQAGVPPFALQGAEVQMRHLGQRRLDRLYDWLLQMNMDMRGDSPLSPRTLFERFLLKLARKSDNAKYEERSAKYQVR